MNFNIVYGLIEKYYYITINRLDRIFDIIYWPVVGLLVWFFTGNYMKEFAGAGIVYAFLGATVLWIFFQRAAQDISVYILEDFWSRNLYNLFSTPLKSSELVTAVTLFGAIRSFFGAIVLISVSYLLYGFNFFGIGIVNAALSSLNLLLFGWVVGLFVSAFIFRHGVKIQVLAWSIPFLMQPFSAVYYPLSSMPAFGQSIAKLLPCTYVFEGMRYSLQTGQIGWNYLWTAFLLNIVLLVIMAAFFSNSIELARKKGVFVRRE